MPFFFLIQESFAVLLIIVWLGRFCHYWHFRNYLLLQDIILSWNSAVAINEIGELIHGDYSGGYTN